MKARREVSSRGMAFGVAVVWMLAAGLCPAVSNSPDLTADVYARTPDLTWAAGKPVESVVTSILAGPGEKLPQGGVTVDYPLPGSIFPPDIVAPEFLWHDSAGNAEAWMISVTLPNTTRAIHVLVDGALAKGEIDPRCVDRNNAYRPTEYQASGHGWVPEAAIWETMKSYSVDEDMTVTIRGLRGSGNAPSVVSIGRVRMQTSSDPVGAPIFYRDVPLMPSESKDGVVKPLSKSALPLIEWRLRDISKPSAPVVMGHMPTCANCHSFSRDGKTLGMDMDGPDGDKGAYMLANVQEKMVVESEDVFSWNRYNEDITTFGLFSRVSPDGRLVVSSVDEEVFVTNYKDYRFLQSFYPTRGILAVRDRETGTIRPLPGADDPAYVHCNAVWSPDGKTIVFCRAPARPAYGPGPRPVRANDPREPRVRYDLYRIPYNDGKGGQAQPLRGASNNGQSNTFPKFSPDGKWIAFVKCANGLLMRPDGRLFLVPADGGQAREMTCNTRLMNSWHSWSPNGRWLVFSSKANKAFTEMMLTHVDEDGNDSPPILVPNSTALNRAVNLPEFANVPPSTPLEITTPAVDYRRRFEEAEELEKQGRHEDAVAKYRESLALKDDYPDTHLALGKVLYAIGRVDEAIACFKNALEVDYLQDKAHYDWGCALSMRGELDRAIEQYVKALELNPRNAQAFSNMGVALVQKGEPALAIECFGQAVEIDPNLLEAQLSLGVTLVKNGDHEAGLARLRTARELAEQAGDESTASRIRKAIGEN